MKRTSISDRLHAAGGRPPGFDYLRLMLAIAVMVPHSFDVSYGSVIHWTFWESDWRFLFGSVVPLFFALSGFLVAGSLVRCRTLAGFAGLRLLRIVPALAVEVFLSALVLGPLLTALPLRDYFTAPEFRHYFLNILGDIHYELPGLFAGNPLPRIVNAQLWTVPYELYCYAALIFFSFAAIILRRPALIAALVVTFAAALEYLAAPYISFFVMAGRGPCLILCFLCGVFVYTFREKIVWNVWLFAAAVAAEIFLLATPHGGLFLALPSAYMAVYLGVLNPRRVWLIRTGDYSYGIYIYGQVVEQAVAALGPPVHVWYLNLLIAVPCAFAIAAMSWHFVERPALGLRKRLESAETTLIKNYPRLMVVLSPMKRGAMPQFLRAAPGHADLAKRKIG